ncbi:VOC family protein [Eubacterium sp.]|uniref:VOC family protein n=1 Tax=Eubacterium sp. TaxID=142586 RepID=UPI00258A295B|nr:VOC family protein [Eubacterium sp.]MCR5368462.1 VOC family protein [Eubacterium sp.]
MITGIDHFAIIVSSDDTLKFYQKLGFVEYYRKVRQYDTVVLLNGFGIRLECFIDDKHPQRCIPEPLGLRHIAFKVDNIEKTLKELEIKDAETSYDWVGTRYAFIKDSDYNIVELHE